MDRIADSKCDFCSKAAPEWCLPAQEFYHKARIEPATQHVHAFMKAEWAACTECLRLINSGDNEALARRVFQDPAVRYSFTAMFYSDELVAEVMKFQNVFRSNRLYGPPVLIS